MLLVGAKVNGKIYIIILRAQSLILLLRGCAKKSFADTLANLLDDDATSSKEN